MKLDVLLTDGHYKHTYGILRALVEKGLSVGILFHTKFSLSYYSRLVTRRFSVNRRIFDNELIYKKEILRILRRNDISTLLPVGNISSNMVSKYKSLFEKYTRVPVVDYDVMRVAQYKNETFRFAERCGIPIPKTLFTRDRGDLEISESKIRFPCVIKKVNPFETGVFYCNDANEFKTVAGKIGNNLPAGYEFPIIQEYIDGKGVGFYALYDCGKCIAYFMHERIHEYPITGGASTLAKSVYDIQLKKMGTKLLTRLKWHGAAMVEFKKDAEGNVKLMEINPKFWGSLELSHKAGINFPYLLYLLAMGKEIPTCSYENAIYFRWTFPHDTLWQRFASREAKRDFDILRRRHKIYSSIYLDDPLTVLYNLSFTIYKLLVEKKYPHGRIAQ